MSCRCEAPTTSPDPRKEGDCCKCGRAFESRWLSTDETVGSFFSELENCLPRDYPTFSFLRKLCEDRESAGRDTFGLAYLERDNLAAAAEELGDFIIYLHLEALQHLRATGGTEDSDLTRTAAWKAVEAYEAICELAAKRKGFDG